MESTITNTTAWSKGIQQKLMHKNRGVGEEIIKSGTQLHFLLSGKAVTSFAESFAQTQIEE